MPSSPQRCGARRVSAAAALFTVAALTVALLAGGGGNASASQTIPTAPASSPAAVPVVTSTPPPASSLPAATAAPSIAPAETKAVPNSTVSTKATTTRTTSGKAAPSTKQGTSTKAAPTTKAGGASRRNASGQWSPNGRPTGGPIAFSATPASADKSMPSAASETDAFKAMQFDGKPFFFLIVGSDARPGEKVDRSRSDAVHLFAYNPIRKRGALIGFPRDTWVTPPGQAARKLSGVLSTAGPDALVQTVKNLTGLPISGYIITGFDGFTKMVDGIGGVNIRVSPAMNDKYSGAQFQEGWFQMNGEAALAYSRARKTLPKGDLSRSANQEKFLLATLGKLRETTGDVKSLTTWVSIARKHTVTNIKPGDWLYFAQAARGIDPASLTTAVVPAAPKNISGQSAVVLTQPAFGTLMKDLVDGFVG